MGADLRPAGAGSGTALGEAPGAGVAPPWVVPAPVRAPVHPRRARLQRSAAALGVRAEQGFAVLALFLFTGALLPLLLKESGASVDDLSAGNPVLRLVYTSVHGVTLSLLAWRWRDSARAALRHWPTLALVALAVASVAWSDAPDVTLRRSFALVGTTALGIWLAARFPAATLLRLLAAALGLVAVLSLVFAVALPALGVDQDVHAGAWRGVFIQKNTLAQVMVLGAIVCALAASGLGRLRWAGWGGAALCTGLVLGSTSKTGLAILLTFAALVPLLRTLRGRLSRVRIVLAFAILAGGGAGLWAAANTEQVLSALGRDATLTGRTDLWAAAVERISERPVAGYGHSAFWLGHSGPSAAVLERVGWEAPHAHNGALDLALDLGLLGLALYVLGYAVATARAAASLRRIHTAEGAWPLVFLLLVLLYNVTESVILRPNNLFWVLYVATVCSASLPRLARSPALRRRSRARAAAPAAWPPPQPLPPGGAR